MSRWRLMMTSRNTMRCCLKYCKLTRMNKENSVSSFWQWKGYVKCLCKEEYYKAVLSGQPKDTDRAWLVALKDPTLIGKLEKHNKVDWLFFLVCTVHIAQATLGKADCSWGDFHWATCLVHCSRQTKGAFTACLLYEVRTGWNWHPANWVQCMLCLEVRCNLTNSTGSAQRVHLPEV